MKTIKTRTLNLTGNSYEIGYSLGKIEKGDPARSTMNTAGFPSFHPEYTKKAMALFARWCPGLNEELAGFSDAAKVAPEKILYYAMTYLHPNCSHIAVLPSRTENGHPLLARNYEFCDDAENFTLVKTSVNGKYAHIGTSVLNFGRDDGFNDQGLAVTMSSNGFPVGAVKEMRQPAVTGLQFWAVIRCLLENCKNVDEALDFVKDMPIAYNLNLIVLDKSGAAAIVETLDGKIAQKRIDGASGETYLHATNHPCLESLIPYEPKAFRHSVLRYGLLQKKMENTSLVTVSELKDMLLTHYPEGLCCHYYQEFFGTTKSMIIDPKDGTIEICWGGRKENGWRRYAMGGPFENTERTIELSLAKSDPSIYEFTPLK